MPRPKLALNTDAIEADNIAASAPPTKESFPSRLLSQVNQSRSSERLPPADGVEDPCFTPGAAGSAPGDVVSPLASSLSLLNVSPSLASPSLSAPPTSSLSPTPHRHRSSPSNSLPPGYAPPFHDSSSPPRSSFPSAAEEQPPPPLLSSFLSPHLRSRLVKVGGPIGKGSTCTVYRAIDARTFKLYALKEWRGAGGGAGAGASGNWRPLLHELQALRAAGLRADLDEEGGGEEEGVGRLHLPRYYGCYYEPRGRGGHVALVLEYLDNGTLEGAKLALHHAAKAANGGKAEEDGGRSDSGAGSLAESVHIGWVRLLANSLLQGLKSLHDLGLVHRDVKPSNVLIGEDGVPMLSDLGLCSRVHSFKVLDPFNRPLRSSVNFDLSSSDYSQHYSQSTSSSSALTPLPLSSSSPPSGSSPLAAGAGPVAFAGTFTYMSPERLCADAEAPPFAGDVWAAGLTILDARLGTYPLARVVATGDENAEGRVDGAGGGEEGDEKVGGGVGSKLKNQDDGLWGQLTAIDDLLERLRSKEGEFKGWSDVEASFYAQALGPVEGRLTTSSLLEHPFLAEGPRTDKQTLTNLRRALEIARLKTSADRPPLTVKDIAAAAKGVVKFRSQMMPKEDTSEGVKKASQFKANEPTTVVIASRKLPGTDNDWHRNSDHIVGMSAASKGGASSHGNAKHPIYSTLVPSESSIRVLSRRLGVFPSSAELAFKVAAEEWEDEEESSLKPYKPSAGDKGAVGAAATRSQQHAASTGKKGGVSRGKSGRRSFTGAVSSSFLERKCSGDKGVASAGAPQLSPRRPDEAPVPAVTPGKSRTSILGGVSSFSSGFGGGGGGGGSAVSPHVQNQQHHAAGGVSGRAASRNVGRRSLDSSQQLRRQPESRIDGTRMSATPRTASEAGTHTANARRAEVAGFQGEEQPGGQNGENVMAELMLKLQETEEMNTKMLADVEKGEPK